MAKKINEVGHTYGRLTVLKEDTTKKGTGTYWICKCQCGNIISAKGTALRFGSVQSCGCLAKDKSREATKKDLLGKKFGRLTAIEEISKRIRGSIVWKCKCDCGKTIEVPCSSLTSGNTQSCGCLQKDLISKLNFQDMTGMKFGKLTVIERDYNYPIEHKVKTNRPYWKCQCECGNVTTVLGVSLRKNRTMSCGCLKQSHGEFVISSLLDDAGIEYDSEYVVKIGQGYLRFDFRTKDCFIEYDGVQHFQSSNIHWDTIYTHNNDLRKNQYCFDHRIPIIRIPYTIELSKLTISDLMPATSRFLLTKECEKEYYSLYKEEGE